ncbi:MAG TPA: hypothetical protein VFX79_00770 [Candidatus Saccharimonadales bacterium]|nr:hypothetical protein [Candidatus Saccharimonadales bacterium]
MPITRLEANSIIEAKEALRMSAAESDGRPTGEAVRRLALAYIGDEAPTEVTRAPYWLGEKSRWGRGVYMLKTVSVEGVVVNGEELITLSHRVQARHRTRSFAPDIKALVPLYRELGFIKDLGSMVFDEDEPVEGTRQSVNLHGKFGEVASDVVFDADDQRVSGVIVDQMLELPDEPEIISPAEAANRELQAAGVV